MSLFRHVSRKKQALLLGFALCIGLALRIYQFGNIPSGVNRDEASIGYTSYLLLNTGREEHRQLWPLRFESFGDWKQPLYIYLTIPFVWLFGLSPITVRLLSLIAGIGMMVAAYGTARTIRISNSGACLTGLLAASMLSLNPWHFHFSRIALEALVAASLFIAGMHLLMREEKRPQIAGVTLMTLTLFVYHASLIVVPLWFLSYLTLKAGCLRYRPVVIAIAGFYAVTVLLFAQAWFSGERSKVAGTTVFSMTNDEQWQNIYRHRNASLSSKLVHNRYSYYLKLVTINYLRSFSPQFLWLKGGNHPHYNVVGYGNFFAVEIALCAVGILYVVRRHDKRGLLVLIALLIAPLPAAITKDGIHSTRSVFMLPAVQILAAAGLTSLIHLIKNRVASSLITCAFVTLFIMQAIPFYQNYYGAYSQVSDTLFSGYMKAVSRFIYDHQSEYQAVYVTYPYESPYMFYAFYNRLSPDSFMNTIDYYPVDGLGFRYAKSLEKMQFVPGNKDLANIDKKVLSRSLVLCRYTELKGVRPTYVWTDKLGKPEIAAVEGKQLIVKTSGN